MKQNQKPCIKKKTVIDRGKRSKTLNEINPVENISKNLQSFLEISLVQKEVLLLHKLKTMNMSNRNFLNERKATRHIEISRIN